MSEREVTVVIPTRNRFELLERHALRSALEQDDVDVEAVVVDDASDDGTAERVTALGEGRVRVLRHETRAGQAKALNTGIAAARGSWIAFLDDDDVWSPRKLRAQLDAAERRDASFVYGTMLVFGPTGGVEVVANPDPDGVAELLLSRNVLRCPSNVMARADLVRALDGFDEQLNELTDWDFFIRLAAAGRAAACPEVVVGYFFHGENRRVRDDCDVRAEFDVLADKHRSSRNGPAVEISPVGFARWLAMGYLRAGRRLDAVRTYLGSGFAHRSAGNVVRGIVALAGERPFALRRRALVSAQQPAWLERFR